MRLLLILHALWEKFVIRGPCGNHWIVFLVLVWSMHLGIQIRVDMGEMLMRKAHIHCSVTVGEKNFSKFFSDGFIRERHLARSFSRCYKKNVGSRVQSLQRGRVPALDVSLLWSFADISPPKKTTKNTRHFEKDTPNCSIFCDEPLSLGHPISFPKNELDHPLTKPWDFHDFDLGNGARSAGLHACAEVDVDVHQPNESQSAGDFLKTKKCQVWKITYWLKRVSILRNRLDFEWLKSCPKTMFKVMIWDQCQLNVELGILNINKTKNGKYHGNIMLVVTATSGRIILWVAVKRFFNFSLHSWDDAWQVEAWI